MTNSDEAPNPDLETTCPSEDRSLGDTDLPATFANDTKSTEDSLVIKTGSTIGDYRLVEMLGRGGMGIVYKAVQESAGRTVALKLIRGDFLEGMGEAPRQQVTQRFQAEARAAAQLDHDHLVSVYEVGEAGGHHFYSMQFVEGNALIDLVREGPLEELRAARYLEAVARAVAEAHQHQILHRDLKPHNILVDARSDRALVADFGLAKLMEVEQGVTQTGEMMGSPPYMAPEQSRDASGVDHRADVYGLGATLYHALCGRPPFQGSSVAAVIQQVNEQEPIPPTRLNPGISRDIETICLKCLEKEPLRRYDSAADFADDLHRLRSGEPIKARPLSVIGRATRWCQRKPATAAMLGIIASLLAVVLVGGGVMLQQLSRTNEELSSSLEREQEATRLANEQAEAAQRQTTKANLATELAEDNFRLAHEAVQTTVSTIAGNQKLNTRDQRGLRKQLIEPMLPFLLDFVEKAPENPNLRFQLANAYLQLSHIYLALGETEKQIKFAQAAVDSFEKLNEKNYGQQRGLAASLTTLGDGFTQKKNFEDAAAMYLKSLGCYESLLEGDLRNDLPTQHDHCVARSNLGTMYAIAGEPAKAVQHLQLAIESRRRLRKDHPKEPRNLFAMATSLESLGNSHTVLNQFNEAQTAYEEARKILETLKEMGEPTIEIDTKIAGRLVNLAILHVQRSQYRNAIESAQNAIGLYQHLMRFEPTNVNHGIGRSQAHQVLAEAYRQTDQRRLALRNAEIAANSFMALNQRIKHPQIQTFAASSLDSYGTMLRENGDLEKAIKSYRDAQRYFLPLAKNPANIQARGQYANSLKSLGTLYLELENTKEAKSLLESATTEFGKLVKAHPQIPDFQSGFVSCQIHLARLALDQDGLEGASKHLDAAKSGLDKLPPADPWTPIYRGRYWLHLGELATKRDPKKGVAELTKAIVLLEDADKSGPTATNIELLLIRALHRRARLYRKLQRDEEATDAWTETVLKARRLGQQHRAADIFLEAATALSGAVFDVQEDKSLSEEQRKQRADRWAEEVAAHLHAALTGPREQLHYDLRRTFRDPNIQKLLTRAEFAGVRKMWAEYQKEQDQKD